MLFSNISFILNKPQLSENIGACARALKNFNFNKLIIINPKPIFPNDKIMATSVGAKEIIINSEVYENLEPAIKKIDYLIATTSRFRNKNLKHINLKDLSKIDLSKKNEEELGLIFTFFVLETILLSRLMKVNPFNQPAIEQIKLETKKLLT